MLFVCNSYSELPGKRKYLIASLQHRVLLIHAYAVQILTKRPPLAEWRAQAELK
jgi:hypothetical protein